VGAEGSLGRGDPIDSRAKENYLTMVWKASSGLIVCGYQFSDREPCELAALFTRAIAELKEASP
jgi:hypothetical protein